MSDDERLSPGTLHHLVHAIREGDVFGPHAKRVLSEFAWYVDNGGAPDVLMEYLRDAFLDYLEGKLSLDRALGLVKRKAGPATPSEEEMAPIAAEIWRARLEGKPHQEALEIAAELSGCGTTKAGNAWRKHQQDGLVRLRLGRALDKFPWTPEEIARIEEVAGHQPWLLKIRKHPDSTQVEFQVVTLKIKGTRNRKRLPKT
jgi:hypothetical protein